MIRSFFVPFVHSLHIEISLNLSVFLRDSLSENTSFTSFTVVSVSAILYSVLNKKANDPFLVISLFPFVRKQFPVFFNWCVRLPFGCSVYHIREILK